MGSTAPSAPEDPDDLPAVEPGPDADPEDSATGRSKSDDGLGTFRGVATANPVELGHRQGRGATNESGDAVQGAVVDEATARAPAEAQPSAFDFDAYFLTHHDRLVAAVRRYCAGTMRSPRTWCR